MIDILEADLARDGDQVVKLLREHLTARSDSARFNWLYKNCPHGVATLWLAVDAESQAIVGSAAIVPTVLQMADRTVSVAVMLDFWVHPDHRVLGPAVKLQRACIEGARAAGLPLFLDLPQGSMTAVYKRLKIEPQTSLVRLARPVNIEPYLRKLPGLGPISGPLGSTGNFLLKAVERFQMGRGNFESAEQPVQFGPAYTTLSQSIARTGKIYVSRSAEHLNWRYRDHYYLKHRLFTTRAEGKLLAYAVLTVDDEVAQLVDLFGELSQPVIRSLLGTVINRLRADGVAALNLPLSGTSELRPQLHKLGFRARQQSQVIAQPLGDNDCIDLGAMRFTYGDLDF